MSKVRLKVGTRYKLKKDWGLFLKKGCLFILNNIDGHTKFFSRETIYGFQEWNTNAANEELESYFEYFEDVKPIPLTVNQIECLLKRIEDTKVIVGALIDELDGVGETDIADIISSDYGDIVVAYRELEGKLPPKLNDGVCLFCGETMSVYADKCPRCGKAQGETDE